MKKLYISPKAIYVRIATESLLAGSDTMMISDKEVISGWTQKQETGALWDNWSE